MTNDYIESLLEKVGLELTPDDVKQCKDALLAIATGQVIERTKTEVTVVVMGCVEKETTTISEQVNPPDWRAAAWILEAHHKTRQSKDGPVGDAAAT